MATERWLTVHGPALYRIEVQGEMDEGWADWFNGLTMHVSTAADGTQVTALRGIVADQAALHGILQRVYGLGLPLLGVRCEAVHAPVGGEGSRGVLRRWRAIA